SSVPTPWEGAIFPLLRQHPIAELLAPGQPLRVFAPLLLLAAVCVQKGTRALRRPSERDGVPSPGVRLARPQIETFPSGRRQRHQANVSVDDRQPILAHLLAART